MRKKLIGLSLSVCVGSIARGEVSIEDVECIIAGTRIRNENDMEKIMESYRYAGWSRYPDKAEGIARKLFSDGKVFQPRVEGLECHNISRYIGNIWVELQFMPNE